MNGTVVRTDSQREKASLNLKRKEQIKLKNSQMKTEIKAKLDLKQVTRLNLISSRILPRLQT
jgi:hypothetical protein